LAKEIHRRLWAKNTGNPPASQEKSTVSIENNGNAIILKNKRDNADLEIAIDESLESWSYAPWLEGSCYGILGMTDPKKAGHAEKESCYRAK
jgi:hypothetical protein